MMADPAGIVGFRGVSKVYPNGTPALQDVSFDIGAREIHAICGENGAGKSTLMNILAGIDRPTAGEVLVDGKVAPIPSAAVAAQLGIGMVHQHFSLVPSLTVAENVALGNEPRSGLLFDRAAARATVRRLADRFNLRLDPDAPVGSLSVAAQQKAEILKALSRNARMLILDEPTAVLTPQETDELFDRLLTLKAEGVTVLFISHKLREVRALADRITVLRRGRVAGQGIMAEIDDAQVSRMVMGQDVRRTRRVPEPPGHLPPKVELRDVVHRGGAAGNRLSHVTLAVHPGEILGVAGVDGSGQGGLVELLTGQHDPQQGEVLCDGKSMRAAGTPGWRRAGMAHLPADRFAQGGARNMTLIDNALAGAHRQPRFSRGPLLRPRAMQARTEELIAAYDVRATDAGQLLGSLSGGNAQKLIAAREFATRPGFLLIDQPTRGIDIAAAALIHERVLDLARAGTAVLLITADLEELLSLSDRVVVLHDGQVGARLENGPALTPERLGPFMLGLETAA